VIYLKVLFLSVSAGGGHDKAAQNLKRYIETNYKDMNCLVMDTLKEINPLIDKVVIGSYLGTLKASPKLYGKLYSFADSTNSVNDFSRQVNKLLSIKLHKFLKTFNPDVIVCTHPFPIEMLNILKSKRKIDIPTLAILTDYAPHSFWLYSNVDKYIIPHESLKYEMIEKGIPDDRIASFGLPTDKIFCHAHNKSECLDALGLENKPTILIMGGSLGFGNIEAIFENLLPSLNDFQTIIVCGKNKKLYNKLERYNSKDTHILEFTNQIAYYMSVADILVTKPGGMTITEALNIGVPMALISPIPGHEEKNARFLLNQGAAISLSAEDSFIATLKQLLYNPTRLSTMKQMAKSLSKPNAQEDISALIRQTAIEYTESKKLGNAK
jgi:processive 1,2-diacylglycerol beta-glucosyltransferase